MRVVILGAGGCFGQSLAMHLSPRHTVMGIGRSPVKEAPYSLGFKWDYMQHHLLTRIPSRELEMFKPDAVVNFAAQAGLVPQSWKYPHQFYATNLTLPLRLIDWLPKNCRYIHIGSSEVYGSVDKPADEDAPLRPSSPYAVSKGAADQHLMTLKDERITIVRPSNCYCPGQALYRLIPRAVHAAITGKKMSIQGNPRKSWLHADDLSSAIELLMTTQTPGLFNVGPKRPVPIRDIVAKVAGEFGVELSAIADETEGRANEDSCFWINSDKILKMGWMPKITLNKGIETMAEWGFKYAKEISGMSTDYEFRP